MPGTAKRGKPADAMADYTRLVEGTGVSPLTLGYALLDRGVLYLKDGKRAEAAADWKRLLAMPDGPSAAKDEAKANLDAAGDPGHR